MNGNSPASTPKAWIQHQNQSSSTVSKPQPLNTGEIKHNYKLAWGVVNNTLNKKSCKDEKDRAAFFVSSQWFCRQSYREEQLSGCAWRTVLMVVCAGLWLLCLLVLPTLLPALQRHQTPAQPGIFQPASQRQQTQASPVSSSSSLVTYAEHSLCLSDTATPGESTTGLARKEDAASSCAKEVCQHRFPLSGDTHIVQTCHLPHLQRHCPSKEGAEPVFAWYLSHKEQPEDSEILGGSGKPPSDLLFTNFPFFLVPVKSSWASWSWLLSW